MVSVAVLRISLRAVFTVMLRYCTSKTAYTYARTVDYTYGGPKTEDRPGPARISRASGRSGPGRYLWKLGPVRAGPSCWSYGPGRSGPLPLPSSGRGPARPVPCPKLNGHRVLTDEQPWAQERYLGHMGA